MIEAYDNNDNDNIAGGTHLGGGPAEGGELGLEGGGARRLRVNQSVSQSISECNAMHEACIIII